MQAHVNPTACISEKMQLPSLPFCPGTGSYECICACNRRPGRGVTWCTSLTMACEALKKKTWLPVSVEVLTAPG